VLANLARTVARLAGLAAPFMPEKAAVMWQLLGPGTPWERLSWGHLDAPEIAGRRVEQPPVLFPKPVAGA
jgi:methionyl-tRNA synthetase